jgi:hypothetical protein
VTHDQAVEVLRTLALSYSKDDAPRLVAALRYVADMADAAKRLEEALRGVLAVVSPSAWDTTETFCKARAVLAAMQKEEV